MADVRWIQLDALREELAAKPEQFTPWLDRVVDTLLAREAQANAASARHGASTSLPDGMLARAMHTPKHGHVREARHLSSGATPQRR